MGTRPFVLLGAGFSRAVNGRMPLLSDLAEGVLDKLSLDPRVLEPFGNDLEQWLSYLAQEQPWLSDADNLRNQAQFLEVAAAISSAIRDAERRAAEEPMPTWLTRLVWSWCYEQAEIATFNYDTLLEHATSGNGLVATWADLYGLPLMQRTAPGTHYMFATAKPPGPTYTLYKLHGSTNWSFGGLSASSADRIVMTGEDRWWFGRKGEPPTAPSGRDRHLFSDLEPMIIPPTGTKAPYYGNRSLRAQWHQAVSALERCDELTVIGYSFPKTDQVVRNFLATSGFVGRVTVVDRREEAAENLAQLLPETTVRKYHGANAVEMFVDDSVGDVVKWGVVNSSEGVRRITARLTLNDVEIPMNDSNASESYDEAFRIAEAEVDRRWPGLRERTSADHVVPSDNGRRQVGYLPPSQS